MEIDEKYKKLQGVTITREGQVVKIEINGRKAYKSFKSVYKKEDFSGLSVKINYQGPGFGAKQASVSWGNKP